MSKSRIGGLRLIWLEAFLLVAEHENYTEAAKAMGCDQSTVSRYVYNLEAWLHRVLTTHTLPFALTEHGRQFVSTAKEVRRLLNMSRADVTMIAPSAPPISASDIDMSLYVRKD